MLGVICVTHLLTGSLYCSKPIDAHAAEILADANQSMFVWGGKMLIIDRTKMSHDFVIHEGDKRWPEALGPNGPGGGS